MHKALCALDPRREIAPQLDLFVERGQLTAEERALIRVGDLAAFYRSDLGRRALAAPVVFYPQVLKNVRVRSKPEAQNDPDVQAAVRRVAEELGDEGRILVRESGTEPVIRVMVEATSDEICEKYVDEVVWQIEKKGYLA